MLHVFASIFIFNCITTIQAAPRIVGGSDAPEGKYPYLVSLKLDESHLCGGSIINKNWILTAAHCVLDAYQPKYLTVVAGTNNLNGSGTNYKVEHMIAHKNFHYDRKEPDIGLLRLSKDIQFTNKVQPINLSKKNFSKINYPSLFAGWGDITANDTSTNELQEIVLYTISLEDCKKKWTKLYPDIETITDHHLCTLNKFGEGTCSGDSGSPLVANDEQIGIISFSEPCAVGVPDVFTRVATFLDWISNEIDTYENESA